MACLGLACAFIFFTSAIAEGTPAPATTKKLSRKTQQANLLALDAVLTMPPSSYIDQDHAWPESLKDGASDEDALINRLEELRRRGADFSTYRHQGTVLLHAIYMHLDRTSEWLIQHGADPLQTVGPGGADALDLAIRMQSWKLVDQLMRYPWMTSRMTPADGARNYFDAYSIFGTGDNRDAIAALLERHVPLPQGSDASCFLYLALERQMLQFALALPADRPRLASEAELHSSWNVGQTPWQYVCDGNHPQAGEVLAFARLSTAGMEQLDHKLVAPLFPYLLDSLRTTEDVERLYSLAIRKPADLTSTQEAMGHLDKTKLPADVRRAVMARLPQAYVVQVKPQPAETGPTEETAVTWIADAARKPTDQFAAAITTVRPDILISQARRALAFMASGGRSKVSVANWSILLKSVPADVFTAQDRPWLLNAVPVAAWPDLFALGYTPLQGEVESWISQASPTDLQSGFPLLLAHQPEVRRNALSTLTNEYVNRCENAINVQHVEKIRTLIEAGATIGDPPILHRECARLSPPVVVQSLLATGALKPPQPLSYHHFVLDTTTCQQDASPVLLIALNGSRELTDGNIGTTPVERVQWLPIPGRSVCGVLASGGHSVSRVDINDEDFYSGLNTMRPCADGNAAAAVWSIEEGKLLENPLANGLIEEVIAIRDIVKDTPYVVALPVGQGNCGVDTPYRLLAWKISKGEPPVLEDVPSSSDVLDAFVQQCGRDEPEKCLGLPTRDDKAASAWNVMRSPGQMVDRLFADRRKAWLDAVMQLDRQGMAAIEQQGIAPHWLYAAFGKISASHLPLSDKRARVALLLSNHANTHASVASLLNNPDDMRDLQSLMDWLPNEDWPVLLDALKENDDLLSEIGSAAKEKKRSYLACSISLLRDVACDEEPK